MIASSQQTVTIYECVYCHAKIIADSPFRTDAPEGYYVSVRRVTGRKNHTITGEVFACSKDCAVNFMQYGISNNAVPTTPIGRGKQ